MQTKQEKKAEEPKVDGFKLILSLSSSLKEVANKLRTISFLEVVEEKNAISASYIQGRDIEKNPYNFILFKFTEKEIEVFYTIVPSTPPKKRRAEIIRYVLNILTFLKNDYEIDPSIILQLFDSTLKELDEYINADFKKLFTEYDKLKKEYEDALRKINRLQKEIDSLNKQNYELKIKNDEYAARLAQLEGMSDAALKEKIQEWIAEHNGEINISEFSRIYKVNESRVEEMLNSLVKEGYISPVE